MWAWRDCHLRLHRWKRSGIDNCILVLCIRLEERSAYLVSGGYCDGSQRIGWAGSALRSPDGTTVGTSIASATAADATIASCTPASISTAIDAATTRTSAADSTSTTVCTPNAASVATSAVSFAASSSTAGTRGWCTARGFAE